MPCGVALVPPSRSPAQSASVAGSMRDKRIGNSVAAGSMREERIGNSVRDKKFIEAKNFLHRRERNRDVE